MIGLRLALPLVVFAYICPAPFIDVWNATIDSLIWVIDRLLEWSE